MQQHEIMALLREAKQIGQVLRELPEGWQNDVKDWPNNPLVQAGRRVNEIQVLFDRELSRDIGKHRDTASTILGTVYVQTLQNRPELLPSLFPLFAALCGDRSSGVWI